MTAPESISTPAIDLPLVHKGFVSVIKSPIGTFAYIIPFIVAPFIDTHGAIGQEVFIISYLEDVESFYT